jgi:hypothetical protein
MKSSPNKLKGTEKSLCSQNLCLEREKGWRYSPWAECFPSMCKALGLSPTTAKKEGGGVIFEKYLRN